MKRTVGVILIVGVVLSVGFVSTAEPVVAQPTKTTDGGQVDYYPGDKIDIELTIPGGTDLFVQPANIVLVLDVSVGMLNLPMSDSDATPRINAAIDALKAFLDEADPTKHRIAFETFGSDGYWKQNFTTRYDRIRTAIDEAKEKIESDIENGFRYWECTSTGDGLDEALANLIADRDTDPGYIILASDGAENGQKYTVDSDDPGAGPFPNKTNHISSFIEEKNVIDRANDNDITIHTVGISKDVEKDLNGVFLGRKCGRIYETGIYGGYRTGEVHLRDKIAAPTGGTYTKISDSGDLTDLYKDVFKAIATDYEITAYERFYGDDGDKKHAYLNPIYPEDFVLGVWGSRTYQVEIHGDGCSGDGDEASKSSPSRYQIEVKWNSIPQGETRCIIIHTTVNRDSPIDTSLPINYGGARDWYYIEITSNNGENTWKVEFNQWNINVLSSPWLKTDYGNVGSKAEITMKSPIPITAGVGGGDMFARGQNASYLVAANGLITEFTSARKWLLETYDPILHGPPTLTGGGYDYYGWLYEKHENEIKKWTNAEATAERCPDRTNNASHCIPTSGFWFYDGTFSIVANTDRGVGIEPTVFFVKRNLNLNDLSLHTSIDSILRPMIFVVGGNINTNVAHDDRITDLLRTFIGYEGPDIPCAYYKGFFFANGKYDVGNSQGLTQIQGSIVANELVLRGDVGKHDPSLNNWLPSEWFIYDPAILWYFRDLLGESQTSFKEVAP